MITKLYNNYKAISVSSGAMADKSSLAVVYSNKPVATIGAILPLTGGMAHVGRDVKKAIINSGFLTIYS